MNRQAFHGENSDRWRALALLAVTLVLSMSTWFSASAVIPRPSPLQTVLPTVQQG